MTLINVPTYRWPGILPALNATPTISAEANLDLAGEYVCYVWQAKEDMSISHVGWRTAGTATGSPTADTRIETVGVDGLPSGALWATNTNKVSGTLVVNAWTLHALTASATITRSQFFAVRIVYASGTASSVAKISGPRIAISGVPYYVTNVTGSVVKQFLPNAAMIAVGSSATAFYNLENSFPLTTVTNSTFDNTSGARRGLRFQVPFNCRCAGITWPNSTVAGDFAVVLRDDAGAELSTSSTAHEGDRSALTAASAMVARFDTGVNLTRNTWYRASLEPSASGVNVSLSTATLPSSDYRSAWPGGSNCHYFTYTTSTYVDAATDQLPLMDILIDQVDDGTGSVTPGGAHIQGGTVVR